jgi:hypothetical protein
MIDAGNYGPLQNTFAREFLFALPTSSPVLS